MKLGEGQEVKTNAGVNSGELTQNIKEFVAVRTNITDTI